MAVGDMFFQAKCMARMKQMMDKGTTVLFVSHDVGAIKSLCEKTIYLSNSQLFAIGKSGEIVDLYIQDQFLAMKTIEHRLDDLEVINTRLESNKLISIGTSDDEILAFREKVEYLRKGNGHLRITNVVLFDSEEKKVSEIEFGQHFTIRIFFQVFKNLTEAIIAFYIKDKNQVEIVGSNNVYEGKYLHDITTGDKFCIDFKMQNILRSGNYSITVIAANSLEETNYFDWVECSYVFQSRDIPERTIWSQVSLPMETFLVKIE